MDEENVAKQFIGLDPAKLVLGTITHKCKKSKTKCQQKKKPISERQRARGLGFGEPVTHHVRNGYSYRQVSRYKFILTGPEPELHNLKNGTRETIDKDSKIGKRYAK